MLEGIIYVVKTLEREGGGVAAAGRRPFVACLCTQTNDTTYDTV